MLFVFCLFWFCFVWLLCVVWRVFGLVSLLFWFGCSWDYLFLFGWLWLFIIGLWWFWWFGLWFKLVFGLWFGWIMLFGVVLDRKLAGFVFWVGCMFGWFEFDLFVCFGFRFWFWVIEFRKLYILVLCLIEVVVAILWWFVNLLCLLKFWDLLV